MVFDHSCYNMLTVKLVSYMGYELQKLTHEPRFYLCNLDNEKITQLLGDIWFTSMNT